jgi:hypothetical protein
MTGAAHYGAMENLSPQLRCSPIQTAEDAKRLLSSVRAIRSTPKSGFHCRAKTRDDADAQSDLPDFTEIGFNPYRLAGPQRKVS